jgi:glycosyltransferase involved in cell wall biosynthesis
MNILQVVSSSRTSGAERHLVILSESLRRLGHNVTAVCPPGGWLSEQLRASGVPALEIPMHGFTSVRAPFTIRSFARRHEIDLIHTHLTRATYMGYLAGMISKVPVVSTVHVWSRDFAYRYLPRHNHWYVAVSDYMRGVLLDRGLPASRVQTVYNGTQFAAPDFLIPAGALSVRAELGLPADSELIGLFGRVDAFKGHPILVRAVRSIVAHCPRAYFVFVGHAEPGIQQALWEMASSDGFSDRLRFTGVRDDVPRLMEAMDVITLPSLTEACSMAIIEAMAVGKPIVATRAGGNLELVQDGVTGLLVERTPESLAKAITELMLNPTRRVAMGEAGKQRADKSFSASAMALNMESLYRRILSLPA